MNSFSDSSDEMYNSDLSSSDAEGLVCGDFNSPAHADLIAMMSEVRNLSAGTPTPKPGAALSEFVGVGLLTNNSPAETPGTGIDLRLTPTATAPAMTRRNSVFAQIAAFAGTIGGKVALSSAVAAASISGAHATGVVDVPYLPDTAAEIETVDTQLGDESIQVADFPEALTFAEDRSMRDEDRIDFSEQKSEGDADESTKADTDEVDKTDVEADAQKHDLTDDLDKKAADEQAEAEAAEKRAIEEVEKAEKEKAELEAKEAAEAEEQAKKAEAEKAAEVEAKKKAEEDSKAEKQDGEVKIASLEESLNRDKEAVIAAARKDIEYYENKRENKQAALNADLEGIDQQFSGYVADIDEQIDAATDEAELAELKAYRENKLVWWEEARADREKAYEPYLAEIDKALEDIERARDAKIAALIAEFNKAVEAAKS